VGTADDQTRLADARTSQLSQALAYPTNLFNILNPLTCAQVGLTAVCFCYSSSAFSGQASVLPLVCDGLGVGVHVWWGMLLAVGVCCRQ
jgi:hypothetical protein